MLEKLNDLLEEIKINRRLDELEGEEYKEELKERREKCKHFLIYSFKDEKLYDGSYFVYEDCGRAFVNHKNRHEIDFDNCLMINRYGFNDDIDVENESIGGSEFVFRYIIDEGNAFLISLY